MIATPTSELIVLAHPPAGSSKAARARLLPMITADEDGTSFFDSSWSRWCLDWRRRHTDARTADWANLAPPEIGLGVIRLVDMAMVRIDCAPASAAALRLMVRAYILVRLGVPEPGPVSASGWSASPAPCTVLAFPTGRAS